MAERAFEEHKTMSSVFAHLIDSLPDPIWQNLATENRQVTSTLDPDQAPIFKFVCLYQMKRPFKPLIEWSLPLDWKTDTGKDVESKLRARISHLLPADAQLKIGFAAYELGPQTTLFDKTATYNDKVYFTFTMPGSDTCAISPEWHAYFTRAWTLVEGDYRVYREICDRFCNEVSMKPDADWADEEWKTIVLLRGLVPLFCDSHIEEHLAQVTRSLLKTLTMAVESDRPSAAYHCANVLEWIAYAYPEVFVAPYGDDLVDLFCDAHLSVAEHVNWPVRVRFEAIWSLGWANVAIPQIARISTPDLQVLEQQPEVINSPVFWAIVRMAWARGLFRQAYHNATREDKAGAFSQLLQDRVPRPEEVEANLKNIVHHLTP
ncbi:MAG: hypothetical protein IT320_20415 [Anaerolineae bacterium]|nr:hypothetical protein [Anaerolineae bacterium]